MMFTCPACESMSINLRGNDSENYDIGCKRCGDFKITATAASKLSSRKFTLRQRANASGWLRDNPRSQLSSDNALAMFDALPPSLAERGNRILINLLRIDDSLGGAVEIPYPNFIGLTYSQDEAELNYLLVQYLEKELGYIKYEFMSAVTITPKGYSYINDLNQSNQASKVGFCAMWFDEKVRHIWVDAIQPAIINAGYEATRIDAHQHNNRIDDEIIAQIRKSKFVVADFTGQRGGVYFEAGFAAGFGLPVIWTCEKKEMGDIHFDTRQYNFVFWERDKLDEFRDSLKLRIEATLGQGPLANKS